MKLPWKTEKKPKGTDDDKRAIRDLNRRLTDAEEKLRRIHKFTYGDKSFTEGNVACHFNGETKGFSISYLEDAWFGDAEHRLPPISQEDAIALAEFILDNYKGGTNE